MPVFLQVRVAGRRCLSAVKYWRLATYDLFGGGICALSPKTVLEGLPMVGVALCRVVKINKNQNIMKSLQFIETKGVAYCAPTMKVLRVFAEEGFSVSLPDLDVEDGAEWDEVER